MITSDIRSQIEKLYVASCWGACHHEEVELLGAMTFVDDIHKRLMFYFLDKLYAW